MKKIKLIIMALAILSSLGGAFATRPHFDCTFSTPYYWTGAGYAPAGVFGVNFGCISAPTTCTYVLINGVYTPCRQGGFVNLNVSNDSTRKMK